MKKSTLWLKEKDMSDFTILVNTCDSYSDLWKSFFSLLRKNWPDCANHKIVINTETKNSGIEQRNIIFINTEYSNGDLWGGRFLHSLNEIDTEYVVVLMDDFFLRNPLSKGRIQTCMDMMDIDEDIACFYLVDIFKEDRSSGSTYPGFAEVPKWRNYRLNSAPGLWRKDKLIKYLNVKDNPWAWEYFGSCRTNYTNDRFYSVSKVNNPIYDYAHVIYRGKWLEENILPVISKYNLEIDLNKRGVVKKNDKLPKRSVAWKAQFVLAGIRMVGLEAFRPLFKDIKAKYVSR